MFNFTTTHHERLSGKTIMNLEDLHCNQSIPILYVYAGQARAFATLGNPSRRLAQKSSEAISDI